MREVRALTEDYIYCPAYSIMNDTMGGHRLSSRFAENRSSTKSRARVQEALSKMVGTESRIIGVKEP